MIRENIKAVEEEIISSCRNADRDIDSVKLIAVSKTKPVNALREAYESGIRDFGENKVQELCEKSELLPKDIRWHMIGHLQTNKVKYIAGTVALIHSVDSLRLAQEIEKQGSRIERVIPILLEVNIAREASKFGLMEEEVLPLVREISSYAHLKIRGLMTVTPNTDDPQANRIYFRHLAQLAVDINNQNIDNVHMDVLSMGMSKDYKIAIEEGATFVRVGTDIFGMRDYKNI